MKKLLIYTLLNLAVVGIANAQDKTSTGSTTTGSSISQTDVKTKVESLYQDAYSKFKASNFDASLALISQAESLLKANSMTDTRFAKLRDDITAAQKAKAANTSSTGSGTGSGSSTTASTTVDTKYKLDAMYQEAASKVKASNPDAALQIIANAEALMKSTGVTDSRFTQLKSDALAMQKSKSIGGSSTGGSSTGSSTSGSSTGTTGSSTTNTVKAKIETYYQDAYSKYKANSFDAALNIISQAEALLKANSMTDVRFQKLRDDIAAAQKAKNTGSTTTTGGTTTGGSNTGSTTNMTSSVDPKTVIDNYYNDAYSLYKYGKYDDSLAIITKAEDYMKSKSLTDTRFGQLRDLIKAKK
jgi:tetratricopeptide (TPR) repeat protein